MSRWDVKDNKTLCLLRGGGLMISRAKLAAKTRRILTKHRWWLLDAGYHAALLALLVLLVLLVLLQGATQWYRGERPWLLKQVKVQNEGSVKRVPKILIERDSEGGLTKLSQGQCVCARSFSAIGCLCWVADLLRPNIYCSVPGVAVPVEATSKSKRSRFPRDDHGVQ